ncbi:organic hydroperoxide resistance protein [Novosphingobium sediminis]|uniref:Organic hydroperoxide resistance protein n=1 Tax=Novosphingobium sediminis TaxID=707214 RepID=A0A512AND3_9SPHN|nr:organic hydroperoxide resistance protein [Novosphingobium sediminis]GEO01204.1 organic hydroperoxide resistance protein [Novosphingobium sediminis]
MKTLYQTQATAIGGRTGSAASADGVLRVQLATPRELGGDGATGTNPEQLFAAGYAACFLSAIRFVAAQAKTAIPADANVTATVGIGPNDKGPGFALAIALAVDLPGLDRATAERLVDAAHQACPYSNATRSNVDVRITIA